jgi:hypothetical protein
MKIGATRSRTASSTGPGNGSTPMAVIQRSGLGTRASRARSVVARIVLARSPRSPSTPPVYGGGDCRYAARPGVSGCAAGPSPEVDERDMALGRVLEPAPPGDARDVATEAVGHRQRQTFVGLFPAGLSRETDPRKSNTPWRGACMAGGMQRPCGGSGPAWVTGRDSNPSVEMSLSRATQR